VIRHLGLGRTVIVCSFASSMVALGQSCLPLALPNDRHESTHPVAQLANARTGSDAGGVPDNPQPAAGPPREQGRDSTATIVA
jgi:hypothetical protein